MGIKTAIIRYMRHFNMDGLLTPLIGQIIPFNIKIFIFPNKGSKNIYNLLNKINVEPTGKHKWNRIFLSTRSGVEKYISCSFSLHTKLKIKMVSNIVY